MKMKRFINSVKVRLYLAQFNMRKGLSLLDKPRFGLSFVSMDDENWTISETQYRVKRLLLFALF